MDRIGCVVIGAGVVGLAVARAMARAGHETIVVERHGAIGMETSSRNSEVIHAGLYYPSGSLKARLCVAGRDQLYRYCDEHGVPYRRCGKLVVATSEAQRSKLAAIAAQAHANGCGEISMLTAEQARALEPALACVAALHSPLTGILDTHAFMLALQGDAERAGAAFAFASRVVGGRAGDDGVLLSVRSGDGGETELLAERVVNCAGLWAPAVARTIEGLDPTGLPSPGFAKGNYYALSGRAPFSRLIYPVPEDGGLGVHLTLDLGGQARFGPDVEWIEVEDGDIDYRVAPVRAQRFYRAIRAYWPALQDDALQPAYAGVRPKIGGPGAPAADFLFASHGARRYLGLYGIESPGLTASLAIAEHALALLR
ncbi:MAG TPA: NAD(P)/FAD-dependent oxidoreductase [Paucimonas sp.]|nr:NAD(P)/FAD-dependent oxidoreductase [Paucimonas sp.]